MVSTLLKTVCPYCGAKFDGHTSTNRPDARPKNKDMCLCGACGFFAQYNENLELVPATDEAVASIPSNELAVAMAIQKKYSAYLKLKRSSSEVES